MQKRVEEAVWKCETTSLHRWCCAYPDSIVVTYNITCKLHKSTYLKFTKLATSLSTSYVSTIIFSHLLHLSTLIRSLVSASSTWNTLSSATIKSPRAPLWTNWCCSWTKLVMSLICTIQSVPYLRRTYTQHHRGKAWKEGRWITNNTSITNQPIKVPGLKQSHKDYTTIL